MNFIDPQLLLPLIALEKSYNPYLVVLSILIACISSFTAFATSEKINASSDRVQQIPWIIFGVCSIGIGIWAIHFISSLALQLPVSVSYNLNITLLSIIPAFVASSIVLRIINKSEFDLKQLLFSGLILAAGLSAMHYISLAAMELKATIVYSKSIFILSVLIPMILATVSLKLKFKGIQKSSPHFFCKRQVPSSIVMALVISSTHYIAMQAVIYLPDTSANYFSTGVDASVLPGIISLVVFLVLIVALIIPHTLRYRLMVKALQANEQDLKIAATSFQTHEAIMVANEKMNLVRVNNAFTRITGYSEAEVAGKNPKFLNSGKQDESFYEKFLDTLNREGKWSGEKWNRRKNGEIFPAWETISSIKDENSKITHYIYFFSDISDFKVAEKEIEKLAFYDPLTELPNRRLLHERLEYELNNAKRYNRAGVLLFLDLDRFKNINDSLGHSIGDEILVETAKRLQLLLRDTDTAVRLGGDEFIILVGAQDGLRTDLLEQSSVIADKVINIINAPYKVGKYELFITTSIGITLYTGFDETVEVLLKRADTAMYQAKEAGRNTFRFYQQSMQEAVDTRLKIERNLRVALSKNEFCLHYQPQFSDEKKVIGVEALIRWNNAELGSVSPSEFLPIAEETGLIIAIGKWTIESVCDQINLWDEQNILVPHIAINISAKQFYQSGFVSMLVQTVIEYDVDPDRIMLEITEGVFLGNLEEVNDKMEVLKESGFSFSVDDFGTGYSSLTYLKSLPFDQLKIDEAFTRDMVNQPSDVAIVKALITMAKGLGLSLIAEGVDTDQHLAYLSGFGCNNYQGYYFSKPLPAQQLSEYLKDYKR